MIEVKKDYVSIPVGLCDDGHRTALLKAIDEHINHRFSSLYKDKSVTALKSLYFGKCAYCECNGDSGFYPEVEHYRPKKGKPKDGHEGYYWLGYEWTNLILCCSKCNKQKGTQFPVNGNRITQPDLTIDGIPENYHLIANSIEFLNEEPLLLNPEIDKPEEHIILLANGKLQGVTDRGKETINICDLNRQKLLYDRKNKLVKFFNPIKDLFFEYTNEKLGVEEFKRNIQRQLNFLFKRFSPQDQYSMVWKWMWYNFEHYANIYLENEEALAMVNYYNEFVKNLENK